MSLTRASNNITNHQSQIHLSFSFFISHLKNLHSLIQTQSTMAIEWIMLGYATGAEAIMVLLLTIPGLGPLRTGLISVIRNLLKPFLSVVPFSLFLFMDIYWKYEHGLDCESSDSCTPTDHLRQQKSIMKSQRNLLLIITALVFYWLLFSVTRMVIQIEQLNARIEKLKNRD